MRFRALLICLSLSLFLPVALGARGGDDPEELQPGSKAKPLTVYQWKADNGLRYTWVVPKGYDGETPVHLSVICHGTGLDYRWGHWNNKPGIFRPNDIVVSVDGPTPNGESRLFMGEPDDAKMFHEFLAELRQRFAVNKVFLYGHSQGGFYVVYHAGEYPDDVAGVVAHASGAWNWSKTGRNVRKVAVAFMHGTMDPVVPYRQSPGSRDAYADDGFELLHLRRLPLYNHWPNAVRATETLDWCQGMTADTPEEALECAQRILEPKKADEYQWTTVVGFAGARDVLRRLVGQGPKPFETVEPKTLKQAQSLIDAIEEHAAKHVSALSRQIDGKKLPGLDGGPWLGHLISLREDFRGVDAVEAFMDSIDYDKQAKAHAKAAGKILDAWYGDKEPEDIYETVVDNLSKAYLFEGLPPELDKKMQSWHADAKKLGLKKKTLAGFSDFEAWQEGWKEGLKEYEDLWKKWKGK